MAHIRKEFSDKDKAKIFKRDRATCAFTGKSVWTFDYGASPLWETDWPDHIVPSSRGGSNDTDNGVCASSAANSKKSSNTRDSAYWFKNGKPTAHYLQSVGSVPKGVTDQLLRLSQLHESDWYLNRAAKNVLLAVQQAAWPEGKSRTPDYWCSAAVKMIGKWKAASTDVASLEDRRVLLNPQDRDQELLLQLRDCETIQQVRKIKQLLIPYCKANGRAYDQLLKALSGKSKYPITDVLRLAAADKWVTPGFLNWLRCTAKALEKVGIEPT